jgi:hypothetical protein
MLNSPSAASKGPEEVERRKVIAVLLRRGCVATVFRSWSSRCHAKECAISVQLLLTVDGGFLALRHAGVAKAFAKALALYQIVRVPADELRSEFGHSEVRC